MEFPVQDFVRERFTDYGTSFSVDIRPRGTGELEIIPQKCFKCPSGMGLFPLSPTLPLLPPNNCKYIYLRALIIMKRPFLAFLHV